MSQFSCWNWIKFPSSLHPKWGIPVGVELMPTAKLVDNNFTLLTVGFSLFLTVSSQQLSPWDETVASQNLTSNVQVHSQTKPSFQFKFPKNKKYSCPNMEEINICVLISYDQVWCHWLHAWLMVTDAYMKSSICSKVQPLVCGWKGNPIGNLYK